MALAPLLPPGVEIGSAADIARTLIAALALLLSVLSLHFQRTDHRTRLQIRARYEYRWEKDATGADSYPRIHETSQKALYVLLGRFLKEHGLTYPRGELLVRFSVRNRGEKSIHLSSVRITLRPGVAHTLRRISRRRAPILSERFVLDPIHDRLLPEKLSGDAAGSVLKTSRAGEGCSETSEEVERAALYSSLELPPSESLGYRFGLTILANTLRREGFRGNVSLVLEVRDRLGNVWRHPFHVDTDLWSRGGAS